MASSASAVKELQRDLENKANDLGKLQKGTQFTLQFSPTSSPFPSSILPNPSHGVLVRPSQISRRTTKSERSTPSSSARTSSSSRFLFGSRETGLENRKKILELQRRNLCFCITASILMIVTVKKEQKISSFNFVFDEFQELDLLKEDANVYKLIGPVLVKQDLAEANANVHKRIEYISAELYTSAFLSLNIHMCVCCV